MKDLDICYNDNLVLYDDFGMVGSLRAFITFNIFGKDTNIQILNGGFDHYKGIIEENNVVYKNKNRNLVKFPYKQGILEFNDINKAVKDNKLNNNDNYSIIDARSPNRYFGKEEEPRKGVRKGNIPNSQNLFFKEFLNTDNTFKNNEEIKYILNKNNIDFENKRKKIISTCGSGVTACSLLFALKSLNSNNNYLYNGSWSEYGSKELVDFNKLKVSEIDIDKKFIN